MATFSLKRFISLAGIKTELKFIGVGLGVSVLAGWVLNLFSFCLLFFVLCYFFWHISSAYRFYLWVDRGMKKPSPQFKGIWFELKKTLKKKKKQQKKSFKRMRQAVKRTSQLTHAIDEGIVVLDKKLALSWWNTTAKQQLGLQTADRGHQITSLVRNTELIEYLAKKKITGRIELPSRANPSKWLMITASRFGDEEIALVISDITPLKDAERLRKEFVGNVSHELRTPITVIRGYLETMTDGMIVDNPPVLKACEQMMGQVIRMQDLADDLIVLSNLESQPVSSKKKKIKLLPLLSSIIEEAEIVSEGKYTITLDCPDELYLMAQKSDLHSAFSNLILNAINHNPEGIDVNVKVFRHDDTINISVQDNGSGISAEAIPRLTERFYRTDSSRSSNIGGSGLGLAIVKHILNRYDANLEITSQLGKGSEFTCIFPLPDDQ